MNRVPFAALFIGWLGVVPFAYGVALIFAAPGTLVTFGLVSSDSDGGIFLLETFGAVILGFMGGCLWGFASAPGRQPRVGALAASAIPPALAFLSIRLDPALSCVWLAFGFVVLQAIDLAFQRAGLTPDYWPRLRLPLTAAVMACLLAGALYG